MSLITTNINFSGSDAGIIFRQAFMETKMLSGEYATLVEAIKGKYIFEQITPVGGTTLIAPLTDGFQLTGNVDMNQRSGAVCPYNINLQFEYSTLINTYRQYAYKVGASKETFLDDTFLTAVITDMVMAQMKQDIDTILWKGSSYLGNGNNCGNGWLTQWATDATVNNIGNSPTLTIANIRAQFDAVLDAVPGILLDGYPLKLFVSPTVSRIYRQALSREGLLTDIGDKPLDYQGFEVVPTIGLNNTNTIVCTFPDNLVVAIDSDSDTNYLGVLDLMQTTMDRYVRMRALFRLNPDYGFGQYVTISL